MSDKHEAFLRELIHLLEKHEVEIWIQENGHEVTVSIDDVEGVNETIIYEGYGSRNMDATFLQNQLTE